LTIERSSIHRTGHFSSARDCHLDNGPTSPHLITLLEHHHHHHDNTVAVAAATAVAIEQVTSQPHRMLTQMTLLMALSFYSS